MNDESFEGTLVLEKLAEIDKVDAFFEAIDTDDLVKARRLMRQAGIDQPTIDLVLQQIADEG